MHEAGYKNLIGIDYSTSSIQLSNAIALQRDIAAVKFIVCDVLTQEIPTEEEKRFGLILDKGTYDAISLSDQLVGGKELRELYPARIARLLQPGGIFLITSCKLFLFLSEFRANPLTAPRRRQLDSNRVGEGICHSRDGTALSFVNSSPIFRFRRFRRINDNDARIPIITRSIIHNISHSHAKRSESNLDPKLQHYLPLLPARRINHIFHRRLKEVRHALDERGMRSSLDEDFLDRRTVLSGRRWVEDESGRDALGRDE